MKCVAISQRVERIEAINERRDALSQEWASLAEACGFLPLPLPNRLSVVRQLLEELSPEGMILSGGNDLASHGGDAPERDETERILLEYAMRKGIPLLGVCRGMQVIADYFGNPLQRVSGHAACRHPIEGEMPRVSVNSYHNWGLLSAAEPLRMLSQAKDGVIEAIRHREQSIMGIMWHPERETPFQDADIMLASNFLNGRD